MSSTELQDYATAWTTDSYGMTRHDALRMSPFAKAASWHLPVKRVDESALLMLLAPVAGQDGLRTIGKQGLRIDGANYIFVDRPVGDQVFVRMDPRDMGRAYVFDCLGENFLGVAIAPELAGIDPAAAIAEAQARRKLLTEEAAAELRRAHRAIKPRDMADAVRLHDAKKAGNLLSFPRRDNSHSTPALSAAAQLAAFEQRGGRAVDPPQLNAKAQAQLDAMRAETAGVVTPPANVQPLRLSETPDQRYRRARELEDRRDRGEAIGEDNALWLGRYTAGAEYRARRMLDEEREASG